MSLHYDSGGILMTGGGRFAHHHVAHLVSLHGKTVLLGKVKQILADFLFLLGRTRHFGNLIENRKRHLRLKIFDFHNLFLLIVGHNLLMRRRGAPPFLAIISASVKQLLNI